MALFDINFEGCVESSDSSFEMIEPFHFAFRCLCYHKHTNLALFDSKAVPEICTEEGEFDVVQVFVGRKD